LFLATSSSVSGAGSAFVSVAGTGAAGTATAAFFTGETSPSTDPGLLAPQPMAEV